MRILTNFYPDLLPPHPCISYRLTPVSLKLRTRKQNCSDLSLCSRHESNAVAAASTTVTATTSAATAASTTTASTAVTAAAATAAAATSAATAPGGSDDCGASRSGRHGAGSSQARIICLYHVVPKYLPTSCVFSRTLLSELY